MTSHNGSKQNNTQAQRFPILFVGAGPGDPELITVKGKNALESADLIVYAGSLVPEAVLKWAPETCEKINSAGLDLNQIIAKMVAAYNTGQRVVRLHTGDPSLYGAIFEQMAELSAQEINYRSIPGVTAAFAAAAEMGLEYTLPEITQSLILTRMAGRTPVPEKEALEKLAAHKASMAIYLSITLVDEVADILAQAYGADATCAVAFRVSQPEQKIFYTPLKDLAKTVKKEKITHQALIIVGQVLDVSHKQLKHKSKLYDREFKHGYRC
jgi:precorrin-4/cobalt-precorrin-4 C11-methyltransferase